MIASLGRDALLRIAPFALFMLLLALRGFAADVHGVLMGAKQVR